jgi:hypothetical protein
MSAGPHNHRPRFPWFHAMRPSVPSPALNRLARGSRQRSGLLLGRGTLLWLLCVTSWLWTPSLLRADPPLDLLHLTKARVALSQDRELAAFNLGVEVKDRTVRLFGTLPTADLDRRAVEILKKLPELREVRSEVSIDPEHKPAVEPSSPSHFLPEVTHPAPPVPSASLTKGSAKREPATLAWQFAPGMAPREEALRGAPPSPAQVLVFAADLSLDKAILIICRGEKSFAGLRHELRGRVVYLSGTVAAWDDAMALARAVSALPGVERVVLSQVRTCRSSE